MDISLIEKHLVSLYYEVILPLQGNFQKVFILKILKHQQERGKRSWKRKMMGTLKKLLKKYKFMIIEEKALITSNSQVYLAILSSSSIVFYKNGREYFLSLFPCDIHDGITLRRKVHEFLEEIVEKIGEPKIFVEIPFEIGKVNYNHKLLGKGDKIVGYVGLLSNMKKIYYIAFNLKTSEEILKTKNHNILLDRFKQAFKYKIILFKGFGDEYGFSAVLFDPGEFSIVTIHTWPESGNVHLEIISKKYFELDLAKIFNNYRVLANYLIKIV